MEYLPNIRDPDAWRRALLCSVASLALTAGGQQAVAQYATTPPAGDEGTMQLPTIAVEGAASGTQYNPSQPSLPKLTEPLLDTPQTITVISRQVIEDQGATTVRDALRNVPGLSIAAGEAGAQGDNLTIRGFTARNDLYLDGMRDFGSYYRDPFYLEGIQVLKGPASILFGRGSTGGVVEQDSKMPKLDRFGSGTLTFGSDLTRRATVDVNEPVPELGQGAALRLNAMVHDSHVAGRDIARNDRFGLAPSLALGLGTPTRLTFSYLHFSEYDVPDYGLPWINSAPAGSLTGLARPSPLSSTGSNYYGFREGQFLRTNVDVGTVKLEHDINNSVTVSNQFRYANYQRAFGITEPQLYTAASANGNGISGVPALIAPGTPLSSLIVSRNQLGGISNETYLVNQLDLTARFRTFFADHTFRTGIEVSRETSDPIRRSTIAPFSQTSLLFPYPADDYNARTFLSSSTTTTAYTQAVYALDTIKLNEQWELMGGLRFDRFDARFSQVTFANPVTGAGAGIANFDQVDTMVSWRGAIIYKPLPFGSVYFSAGTSFNPSAEALSLSMATAALPPEESRTFELGTKWELLNGQLTVTGALFRTEKTNVREPNPLNPLFNILAGNALAEGAEIGISGRLTPAWQILAGYGYTYTAITQSPVTGPLSDLGRRLANAPMHTANLWTTYDLPWWKMQIGGGLNVVSSRFAASTPASVGGVGFLREAPGYWIISAMAKMPLSDRVDLQLNLTNLTDNRFYDLLHPSHVIPGAGRTALLSLTYKY
jgi:catecholate siderophore receptor